MIPKRLLESLVCPIHKESQLVLKDGKLYCPICKIGYPIINDVPSITPKDPEGEIWNTWNLDKINMSGDSYYKRAKGEIPEKDCSRSFAHFINNNKLYNKGDSILDIGCACGHYLKSFREHLDPDVKYTGIDSHGEFLQWGKEIFGINDKSTFVHCDALELPFKDNTFDISVVQLFHFFLNTREALVETIRTTKKYLIWRTPVSYDANYTVKIFMDDPFETLGDINVHTEDAKYDIYNLLNPRYIKGLVEDMGYKIIKVERDTDFGDFDNTALPEFKYMPATKIINGMQINGCLVLDWHYFVIDCGGS